MGYYMLCVGYCLFCLNKCCILSVHKYFSFNTLSTVLDITSVEIIRLGLSLFINTDIKMYYEPNNVAAIARYECSVTSVMDIVNRIHL